MFIMTKKSRVGIILTTILEDDIEVANIVYRNTGNGKFTVEVALTFLDGVHVIGKWTRVEKPPLVFLRGYIQELLKYLERFDIAKILINSKEYNEVIEKLQSLRQEMLISRAKYYAISKNTRSKHSTIKRRIIFDSTVTVYTITKCNQH